MIADDVWKDNQMLIPAIIQDSNTKSVLMLGYMNKESYKKTIDIKKVTFYSRSRKCLWTKGETSGNFLNYISCEIDCDKDTLLIQATNDGPTCHLEKYSCFGDEEFSIQKLELIIKDRKKIYKSGSYTNILFEKGNKEIVKKITDEANELAISTLSNDGRILEKAADLTYYLQVLLIANNHSLKELENILKMRNK
ncbi:MAG: bifunctional phosphoribosyl-AMP cyclohydrolase/phosphoribosyl-ATP diphosphatase [Balneola sp.]|nr:bifunctional phosphoribosyl-AMP cyclohydrolase/phosphoribosyl-ATP diphosphatase [Balneola sp.]